MSGWWCQTLVIGSAMYSANAPGAVDADALGVRAQVAAAGHAVAAAPADDVALAADDVAGREVVDVRADLDHLADELVADHQRRPGSSSAPRRPSRRCAGRCRRCRSGRTRISTSLIPISGSGTSSSHSPGSAWAFTSARIRAARRLVGRVRGHVDDLAFVSAEETAALVRTGDATPREVVEAALRRIEALDPALNAFIEVDGERALAEADAVVPGRRARRSRASRSRSRATRRSRAGSSTTARASSPASAPITRPTWCGGCARRAS